jgi:hypothetical protein
MSISFYPAIDTPEGTRPLLRCACDVIESERATARCAACLCTLNANNRNASDLLAYLGLDTLGEHGYIGAGRLRELCIRRLGMVEAEAELPTVQHGPRHFEDGRPAWYLRERCKELLVIATTAGAFGVAWS